MLHDDAVIITLFVVLPQPKEINLHHLKETKGKLWKQFIIGPHDAVIVTLFVVPTPKINWTATTYRQQYKFSIVKVQQQFIVTLFII